MNVSSELANEIRQSIRAYGQIQENGLSFLTEKTYPEIDQFKVEIFPNEGQHRGRPHCKITTDKGSVTVDLHTFAIIAGTAGPWNHTICKVVKDHQTGLLVLWDKMRPDDQRLTN